MAFEADCGSSTVLEAPCVTSPSRSLVPGDSERRDTRCLATRPCATAARRLKAPASGWPKLKTQN